MAEEKKPGIPRSIRITDETFEKFKQLNEEVGGQAATLDLLLDVYFQSSSKNKLSETDSKAVSDFQFHIHALNNSFSAMIEKSVNAENNARLEVKNQLERYEGLLCEKEKLLDENSENTKHLEESNKTLSEKNSALEDEITSSKAEIEKLKKNIDNLNKSYEEKMLACELDYKQKLSDKDTINKVFADNLENEREKAASYEEKAKKAQMLENENNNLKLKISNLEASIEEIKVKSKIEMDIAQVNQEQIHQEQIRSLHNSYDKTIADIKADFTETERKYKEEISDYQQKYKHLLEQYEKRL